LDYQKQIWEGVQRLEDKVDGLAERLIRLEVVVDGKEKVEQQLESRIVSLETKVTNIEYLKWKFFGAMSVVAMLGAAAINKLEDFF
jgi:hypothetical protein